ncbi:hypothetical protein DFQ28_001670 [Apophysomyces sp. BC1034]|nr:hypothetical protein DFQ29_001670 [Apophysomyces sp. BC1021]KAG0170701.1 hypothetical protein DFQ30_002082 [Apophysomyces sp. BC1015]KAG0190702.1 hypothetical protein DFQ28_001670 [Apophysomyces sp. BC1034]
MPPKKKPRISKEDGKEKTAIPDDAQWCLDRADQVSFKEFIERWDCLDRNRAQQRFGNILAKYFGTKSERDKKIHSDYKNWIATADYLRFWSKRSESIILVKTSMACTELIDTVTEQRLASLHSAVANTDIPINTHIYTAASSANAFDTPATASATDSSDTSTTTSVPGPQKSSCIDTSYSGDACFEVDNSFITISNDTSNDDMYDDPWIFQDTDVTQLFKTYRATIRDIVIKHKTLPIESYTHELAALTHVLILCKNQHSAIAEKIFIWWKR